jgi:hypothetical protein
VAVATETVVAEMEAVETDSAADLLQHHHLLAAAAAAAVPVSETPRAAAPSRGALPMGNC